MTTEEKKRITKRLEKINEKLVTALVVATISDKNDNDTGLNKLDKMGKELYVILKKYDYHK